MEAWKTTAVDIEEVFSGVVKGELRVFLLLMWLGRLTLLIVGVVTESWGGWGCLQGSGMLSLRIMLVFG